MSNVITFKDQEIKLKKVFWDAGYGITEGKDFFAQITIDERYAISPENCLNRANLALQDEIVKLAQTDFPELKRESIYSAWVYGSVPDTWEHGIQFQVPSSRTETIPDHYKKAPASVIFAGGIDIDD